MGALIALVAGVALVFCHRALVRQLAHTRETLLLERDRAQRLERARRLDEERLETLRRAREELEARVQERTAELARSNEELEQFAYVASHDLQEPLRMVSSFVQLLADRYGKVLDQDAREFIGYAADGATRMQALIRGLLAYSRVGRRGTPLSPVPAETCLRNALQQLQAAVAEGNAQVTHDPLPTVLADETQLTQLLQHLIGNAVKFRSQAPPRVHVKAERKGEEWTFSVSDNGIGIGPAHTERIFRIFQRLHTREEYPGTGIGLAICKRIVERHGGRMWVESQPGTGSTFFFTLPSTPGV
ncbi:MAG TPA: ATP-binding protein [Planctomycetota bacterium]|nr:ATP-binding protein [Planctomycetota bacterium]